MLVATVVALAVAGATTPQRAGAALPPGNSTQQWNQIAQTTVYSTPGILLAEGQIYMAYVQVAVYDAVTSIEGGYEPLGPPIAAPEEASVDAAVATAASETLAYYFPAQAASLAAMYAEALALIPDGQAKTDGIAVGHAAFLNVRDGRTGDGRYPVGTIVPFTPTPGPGVWEPTPRTPPLGIGATLPPLPAATPWLGEMRPFVMRSPDQFLPGPPPTLSSAQWADEFNEIKLWGRVSGSPRTPEQTGIALFWTSNTIAQYNVASRDLATSHVLNVLETSRLLAMDNVVAADALIGCLNAKYHYAFWRPITAIRNADTDGNPATEPEAGWTPALTTPNHPEYPAAHGCVSSAIAEVFSEFLGTNRIDVTIKTTVTSPDPNVPTIATRHFERSNDLRAEIIKARLWGGMHYRGSTVAGEVLGRKVAHYDLRHAFQPAD
jgi:hypothetical protein